MPPKSPIAPREPQHPVKEAPLIVRPPLLIHLLAHPQSTGACALANKLQSRFFGPPASGALRVPVLLTPQREGDMPSTAQDIDLDPADHVLVVMLADSRMTRTVRNNAGPQWRKLAADLCEQLPLGESPHLLLPLALDGGGFDLLPEKHMDRCIKLAAPASDSALSAETLENQEHTILFHIAARALQLLTEGIVPDIGPEAYKAPLRPFLSHAKKDLDPQGADLIQACKNSGLQVEHWFDSEKLTPSQAFAEGLEQAVKSCNVLVSFYTDVYESRPWCRREVLIAKENGLPVLLVNMLKHQEARHFPYVGNTATICLGAVGSDPAAALRNQARKVLASAALEALRLAHNTKWLAGEAGPKEIVLGQSPEALTLVRTTEDQPDFLYPDPPLDRQERTLLASLRPHNQIRTPLQSLRPAKGASSPLIAVSLSESEDAPYYGLSDHLWQGLADEVHLYLLMAGYRIGYGGALSGIADATNFTHRLFDLVSGYYQPLCEELEGVKPPKPVVNFAPWPLCETYGDADFDLFRGDNADLVEMPVPARFSTVSNLFPVAEDQKPQVFAVTTAVQRAAWACGLSEMRQRMTSDCGARIVMGGKLGKFSGIVPGVVEEAWLSLQARKPLYLLGGFGGAARALCDLLLGEERPDFTPGWNEAQVPNYAEVVAALHGAGVPPSLAQIGNAFKGKRGQDLGRVLSNGLSDDENRTLMTSIDARTIGQLLLKGLKEKLFATG